MSTRYLKYFFQPASITVVGASEDPNSFGGVVLRNLQKGGFSGDLSVINPRRYKQVYGVPCYRKPAALPQVPELAVVCTPPTTVPGVVSKLGKRGVKAALVLMGAMSGLRSRSGRPLKESALAAARPYGLRLLGPNSLGILVPGNHMNASYAHLNAKAGKVAFVGQSGMLASALLDWAQGQGIGFSHFLTLGDTMDVGLADVIDYLAADHGTKAILLHIERAGDASAFVSAVRAASRHKPVLAFKSEGDPPEAASTAIPGLANRDTIWEEVLRRAGVLRVESADRLFETLDTLLQPFGGERLAIMGNGIGPLLLASQQLAREGGTLAQLAPETLAQLQELLPPFWKPGNPVDLNAGSDPSRYAKAVELLGNDPGVDVVLVVHAPTLIAPCLAFARAIIPVSKCVITCWMGLHSVMEARAAFNEAGVPTYTTPEKAVHAFTDRVHHEVNQELLRQTPPPPAKQRPDRARVETVLRGVIAAGREYLLPYESRELLAAYRIPYADTLIAHEAEDVVELAAGLVGPLALKIAHEANLQPFSTRKNPRSRHRDVVFALETPDQIRAAAAQLLDRAPRNTGKPTFLLQEMRRGSEHALLHFGITCDPIFGPLLLFGEGGVNVVGDCQTSLPPLNLNLARELVGRTRVARLLEELDAASSLDPICEILVRLSCLATDFPRIRTLEINPFLVRGKTLLALDVTVSLGPPMASIIRPYPESLKTEAVLKSGRRVVLRPVRGEDEPAHDVFSSKLSRESIRLRFFTGIARLGHKQLAQLTQIDYDREMAFIATAADEQGQEETLGVVRTWSDPDRFSSEFAVIVRDDLTGQGLASTLIRKMIDYCTKQGVIVLTGTVLPENRAMLGLARHLGFSSRFLFGDGVVEVNLALNEPRDDWQRQRLAVLLEPGKKN